MRAEAIKSRPPGSPPAAPSSPQPPPADPLLPRLPRWRRWLVALLVTLVGLATVVVVGWRWWPHECGIAFSGMRLNDKSDGECIGITDGSYLFNDPSKATNPSDRRMIERINDTEKKIEAENNAVADTDRYVKIILLMPLTVSQARPAAITLKLILHSLEGGYTALYRANHSRDFGDPSAVKLQLLLANEGSRQNSSPDFLNSVLKVSQPDHPVVVVVGLGSSVPNTKTAAEYLAHSGIPMVGAVTAADSLMNLPLFWSVSPSNSEYVDRFKSFLDHQDVLRSGIIVYDRNSDLFTQSLAQAYHDKLRRYVGFTDQPFQGGTIDIMAAPDVFFPVVTNLCNAVNDPHPLDMVFFAGRLADFGAFTAALKARTCRQRPLTVLVVTTASAEAQAAAKDLENNNVKVLAATSSDSASWGRKEPGTPLGYAAFLAAYHDRGFADDTDLSDHYAIGHHDALATAAQATRLAALGTPTHAPNSEDVAGQFGRLNLAYPVRAASGTLSFPPEGGRATGLPIPIQQVK